MAVPILSESAFRHPAVTGEGMGGRAQDDRLDGGRRLLTISVAAGMTACGRLGAGREFTVTPPIPTAVWRLPADSRTL